MAKVDSIDRAKTLFLSKDYKVAFSIFKKLAKDSSEAAYYLGLMYYHGYAVDVDDNQAFNYFRSSWEGLFEEGIYMLGRMYEEGRGTVKNYEQAFKLYQAAANSQNAKLRLANFYEYGKYVEKSIPNAIKIYNELQKHDNAFSMYKIGAFYFSGNGLKKDLNNAYKWLNKALLVGSVDAMNHFRIIGTKSKTDYRSTEEVYETGKSLINKLQVEQALPYLEAAAAEGSLAAIVKMYEVFREGIVLDKDLKRAYQVLDKYKDLKYPKIYYLLGKANEQGKGVESSYVKAAKFYELGAKLDDESCKAALLEIRGY